MKGLTGIDVGVLIAYFALVMGVGIFFWRKGTSVETFTAARRSLPGWVCGLSILATYVSSISFLALPAKSFATNWNPFVFSLSLPLATWIAVRYFMPFYRRQAEISAYSHLEYRFGPWARLYAGLAYLLTQLARVGSVMYLGALPLATLLGWDIRWIIILTGASVTIYSLLGGIVAVIWTDALQAVVLTGGALLCAGVMIGDLPAGASQLIETASSHGKFGLGSFALDFSQPTFWVVLLYGITINLQNFGIDQNYVQRYLASSSETEARKSLWIGGLVYVPLSAVFLLIGTALFVYYRVGSTLPNTLQAPEKADYVFPYFMVTALPPGLTGLLIAAIFAAAMSTVSTSLNSSATLVMTDFYRRYLRPAATERESMLILYLATAAWGMVGTLIALAMIRVKSALDTWWMMQGIFGGGMLGVFLLGIISRRAKNPAAVTAVICGVLVILWMTISPRWTGPWAAWRSPFHSFMVIVVGTLTILLVGLLYSRAGKVWRR